MQRINNNKKVFERIATKYIREDRHWGSDLDLIKISIEEILKAKNNLKWLDIGCGPGFHIASIGELYPEIKITGIDYSNLMLKQACKKIKKLNLKNITLKAKNIIEDNIEEKYDLITFLNNGFGNLYKEGFNPNKIREQIIKKITKSLNKKGYLILSVYNREKLEINYGNNLRLLKDLSDINQGDLFVEYIPNSKLKIIYYSHWFSKKELIYFGKVSRLKVDFLERRMSRFLVRYKKVYN